MSADNGIYILQSQDGFRVMHAQAIENMEWLRYEPSKTGYIRAITDEEKKTACKEYWEKAPFFATKEEALKHAFEIEQEIMDSEFPVLEYGVSIIRVPWSLA